LLIAAGKRGKVKEEKLTYKLGRLGGNWALKRGLILLRKSVSAEKKGTHRHRVKLGGMNESVVFPVGKGAKEPRGGLRWQRTGESRVERGGGPPRGGGGGMRYTTHQEGKTKFERFWESRGIEAWNKKENFVNERAKNSS